MVDLPYGRCVRPRRERARSRPSQLACTRAAHAHGTARLHDMERSGAPKGGVHTDGG
eukprot:COSAG02_NODE_49526_length_326_cov_0.841410_1_plen_56_part_01